MAKRKKKFANIFLSINLTEISKGKGKKTKGEKLHSMEMFHMLHLFSPQSTYAAPNNISPVSEDVAYHILGQIYEGLLLQ